MLQQLVHSLGMVVWVTYSQLYEKTDNKDEYLEMEDDLQPRQIWSTCRTWIRKHDM